MVLVDLDPALGIGHITSRKTPQVIHIQASRNESSHSLVFSSHQDVQGDYVPH